MKLLRFAPLVCALALLLALPAGASDAPAVLLDGEPLSFGVPPTVDRQRVLVPFRALFEALGYDVDWDGPTHSVTAAGGGHAVSLVIGRAEITVDGVTRPLDVAPVTVENRTLVPLRAVSEASGCDVLWDQDGQAVLVYRRRAEDALSPQFTYGRLSSDGRYPYADGSPRVAQIDLADLSMQRLDLHPAYLQPYGGKVYGRIGVAVDVNSFGSYDLATGEKRDLTAGNVGDCYIYEGQIYGSFPGVGFGRMGLDGSGLVPVWPSDAWPGTYITIHGGLIFNCSGGVYDLETGARLVQLESGIDQPGMRDFTGNRSAAVGGDWYYVPFSGYRDERHGLTPRGISAYNYRTGERRFIPMDVVVKQLQATENSLYYTVSGGGGGDALYRMTLEGTHSVLLREKLYDPLVVGNYIYYYGAAGLCRTPTAGGAEEVVYAPTAANLP